MLQSVSANSCFMLRVSINYIIDKPEAKYQSKAQSPKKGKRNLASWPLG